MATVKIIDKEDKFIIEIDGSSVPFVTSYSLTRTVSKTILLKLALVINDADVEFESDKITVE